jgi:hypothetical protein
MHVVIYLILCLIVGFVGRRRKIGFLGYFLLSLILTPLITLLFLVITERMGRARQVPPQAVIICPACTQRITPAVAARHCAHCGAPL